MQTSMRLKTSLLIPIAAIAILAAGCGSSGSTSTYQQPSTSTTTDNQATTTMPGMDMTNIPATTTAPITVSCAANEHSCTCATGNYCIPTGAMCLTPSSPCPGDTPAPAPAPSSASKASVTISNFAFGPSQLTVKKGTTVTWTNQDSAPHTVTGDNGGPSSGDLNKGDSYSYTFNQTGTFSYHCAVHPYMVASVTVTP